MPQAEFDVFLSYNRTDQPEVLKLATQLKERGLNPWLDVWNLVAGEPWLPAVEHALANSGACAVLVGPAGLGGVHQHEMWTAIEHSLSAHAGHAPYRVIPTLLPRSTRGDRATLPRFLSRHTWIEFQQSLDEPGTIDKLVKAIRGEAPGATAAKTLGQCPYRGLAHFEIADAPLFFGREALTDWLLSRLRGTATTEGPTRFLAIVGASGSGKSSLARAGLLAKLKQGELAGSARWPIVVCRPENRPLESLAAALANADGVQLGSGLKPQQIAQLESLLLNSPDGLHKVALAALPADDPHSRLVVFVDQFEELFTLNPLAGAEVGAWAGAGPFGKPRRSTSAIDLHATEASLQFSAHIALDSSALALAETLHPPGLPKKSSPGHPGAQRSSHAAGSAATDTSAGDSSLSDDRVAYVQNLLHAATIAGGRTIVVLTMRADFYGKCASLPELATAVSQHQELVGPMSRDELRRAIEAPAQLSGSDIEPGLVDQLVREVAAQPGALPLLQYALAELWQKSRDLGRSQMTSAAYRDLGGWEGALSRRADAILGAFKGTPREKLCRQLFLRLVQPGEGTEDTKRLVRWQELQRGSVQEAAELEATLRELVDSRLLTASGESLSADSTVEVIHEALIRGWAELRKWLDADRAGLRTHRQLTDAANEWAKSHADAKRRDPSLLYTGTRLAVARELAKRGDVALNDIESQFLEASTQGMRSRKRRSVLTWAGTGAAVGLLALVGTWMARNNQNDAHAREIVESLKSAKESQVPEIVKSLADFRRWADEPLRQLFAGAGADSSAKLHAALALAPVGEAADAAVIPHLRERLLTATPAQFPLVRDALAQHDSQQGQQIEDLWKTAQDAATPIGRRFQAACALATFTPEDARWPPIAPTVAQHLVGLPAAELVAWREALQPARKQLLKPLAAIYRNTAEREQGRTYAAETLAEYAVDDPDTLFDLLADAEQFQFPTIYSKLADHRRHVIELGKVELATQPAADASEDAKETLGTRQANVAVALLKLGAAEHVWPVLKHSPDPRARSYFIHWLSPLGGDPHTIILRFDEEPDVTIRRALLLALGEFTEGQLPPAERAPLIEKLQSLYESDPDAGLHAAAEWLLRTWKQEPWLKQMNEKLAQASQVSQASRVAGTDSKRIGPPGLAPRSLPGSPPRLTSGLPNWYVNTQAQTFVILEPGTFEMGSPESDPDRQNDEIRHLRRVDRTIAIAAKEITWKEYQRFLDDETNRDVQRFDITQYSRTDDSPQVALDWYDSAHYCNWLSQTEGIPNEQWCYEPNKDGKYAEGMQPAADFLERTGYRLPTEAEWEFACRADSVTSRYYGASVALLPNYAWSLEDSTRNYARATGLLKPNDFGLFDMLGNAMEWCHDAYRAKYSITDTNDTVYDAGDKNTVEEKHSRVLRGGSFDDQSAVVRSGSRDGDQPGYRNDGVGFRPARTYR